MILLGIVCLFAALFFLVPVGSGIYHIGMFWPAAILLYMSFCCFFPELYKKVPEKLRKIGQNLVALWLVFVLILSLFMAKCALRRPPEDLSKPTVIVLGCQVYNGQPSLMLRSRIETAYTYLSSHPDSVCIASGGMDDEETITEAQCIFQTLTTMGIAPERIYLEDRSTSTFENLSFSSSLISEHELSRDVVIATDNFHEMRASIFASRSGLTPYSIGTSTIFFLSPGYWCREIVGLLALFVRGY